MVKSFTPEDILDRPFSILLAYDYQTRLWTAHCLEFDIVEDGKSREEALYHLFKIMRSNVRDAIKHKTIRQLFQPAPSEYWVQALAAKRMDVTEILEEKRLSDFHLTPQKLDLKCLPAAHA